MNLYVQIIAEAEKVFLANQSTTDVIVVRVKGEARNCVEPGSQRG